MLKQVCGRLHADSLLSNPPLAAQKHSQGWHFMNVGADIVAVTAWMSKEMAMFKSIIAEKTNEVTDKANGLANGNGPKTSYS